MILVQECGTFQFKYSSRPSFISKFLQESTRIRIRVKTSGISDETLTIPTVRFPINQSIPPISRSNSRSDERGTAHSWPIFFRIVPTGFLEWNFVEHETRGETGAAGRRYPRFGRI